ncbi:MAG TPA: DUF6174 domain-containing protein [Pirellulales bacterium]|jgi:hypothetical protein|nr:DUF6174 domain-containing protein [Pirellulales bacterium]
MEPALPDDSPKPDAPLRRRSLAGPILIGAVLSILLTAAGIGLFAVLQGRVPLLTDADFARAEKTWETAGPQNYQYDLLIGGRQSGKVHAVVHHGVVTELTRDGLEPKRKQTWDYWRIEQLFDFIADDLAVQKDPAKKAAQFNIPGDTILTLRAKFDPRYGYPIRYRRAFAAQNLDLDWSIVRFEPLPP